MKENPNIDELLNGFIDAELTERQRTEVQRLISHDEQIADRLRQLEKSKMLVGSLPCVEAPAEMLENIKSALERRTLLGQQPEHISEREGARHLLLRRVAVAAAMIGLVAVLAAVIYTILAPEKAPDRTVAVKSWRQPADEDSYPAERKSHPTKRYTTYDIRDTSFNGTLELKTAAVTAVSAFISKSIKNNQILESAAPEIDGNKITFTVSCSREGLKLLLADLESIKHKFDSATLFVGTEQLGEQIKVESVDIEQVAEIISQDSFKSRIETARDFAILNNINELLPGKDILAVIDNRNPNLPIIPKPALTSGEKTIKKPPDQTKGEQKVNLTIVVTGSK
ncbi:MAG: hypothetical protein DRP62_08805 [Planctomycetota bacterium]|nr:MAG: hypothetical protein DRP62_08805 [Planctomycetota bacterium]